MDIFISINNRERVLRIPVIPEEFQVESPFNNETYTTISQGDIKLIGLRGLKSISWQSFFPAKEYPFNRDNTYKAWEYVRVLEEFRDRRLPVRLVIPEAEINMAATIDEFNYGLKDGSGDVYYSITLSEFKFVQIRGG
ncbi:MAG: hypothetical protein AB2448_01525 [Moorella sp. (in: firmicutes)]